MRERSGWNKLWLDMLIVFCFKVGTRINVWPLFTLHAHLDLEIPETLPEVIVLIHSPV